MGGFLSENPLSWNPEILEFWHADVVQTRARQKNDDT